MAAILTRRGFLLAPPLPDLASVPPDLTLPDLSPGSPGPGRRVRVTPPEYAGTDVHHILYLPPDWRPRRRYPAIVEYAGNGNYRNAFGDISTGLPEGSKLGYGLTGGRGALWLCLPYVARSGQGVEITWWGDPEATLDYCHREVARVCADWGGDRRRILLAGFSRGAIACQYLGLRDDRIAALWCGFFAHSHWDGVRRWNYPDDDPESARRRAFRLRHRPVFLSHEGSVDAARAFVAGHPGRFTFCPLPFRNHSDAWLLRDLPERRRARAWLRSVW